MKNNSVTVMINGDSGDGVQLLGQLLSRDIARSGIHIQTQPNYPAEIRAPQGTPSGISGFKITTAEEQDFIVEHNIDVLVAMNPAGLVNAIDKIKPNGILITNSNQFGVRDYNKAKIPESILANLAEKSIHHIEIPITELTAQALNDISLSQTQIKQARNMFVLGVLLYLFDQDYQASSDWVSRKLIRSPELIEANKLAIKAGFLYLEVQEFQLKSFEQPKASTPSPGNYRQLNGNQAIALSAMSIVSQINQPMLLSGYPITPATTIMQEMLQFKGHGIDVVQAEDEIAACGIALGASYAGHFGLTCTSGPGLDLKMEMIGLAVMTELPLVIIDVQRAGPSTGMPTKTQQSDLLHAIYGRHGESPCVVIAASSPADCFYKLRLSYEIAYTFSTPVILLSDASIANSSEVWKIPSELPDLLIPKLSDNAVPFSRNKDTMARVLFKPGTPDVIQTIGGLEKNPEKGTVSYDSESHQSMSSIRKDKINCVTNHFAGYEYLGDEAPDLLIVAWGSSFKVSKSVWLELKESSYKVALLRIDILFPLNLDLAPILNDAQTVCVVEHNDGQLCSLLRSEFLINAKSVNALTGQSMSHEFVLAQLKTYFETECPHG